MEDSALTLKKADESGDQVSIGRAKELLAQSELIKRLLTDPNQRSGTYVAIRGCVWRLMELSEIPYTYTLEKVQEWLNLLVQESFIQEGFSLSGDKDGLLACHNAMVTTILIRMNYPKKEIIDAGVNWILDYQSVERGSECTWSGADLLVKYGGCMRKTPCFYGVVKSMVTLTEYRKRFEVSQRLEEHLNRGLEYILAHKVYQKLSSDEPIAPSMIENFYPYPYKTNLIEVLSLLKANGLLGDERCKEAIQILRQKQRKDGFWQADVSYMKTAWVDFDRLKKPGLWISYVIGNLLQGIQD